jgi:hypothetical protein
LLYGLDFRLDAPLRLRTKKNLLLPIDLLGAIPFLVIH